MFLFLLFLGGSAETYKHRGRVNSLNGRRPKDQERRVQMLVNDDGDNCYHTLSKQKNAKKKHPHSLKNAVDHNQPGTKKRS